MLTFETLRVVVTGGGSGGHTSAAVGIIEALIEEGVKREHVLWMGSAKGIERQVAKQSNIPFRVIPVGKLRRYWSLENLIDVPRVIRGFFQSITILRSSSPSVVISTGGFVSVPVIIAARLLGIPIVVHEQTIIPGLANRIAERVASRILLSFKETVSFFDSTKTTFVGNPLRVELKKGLPCRSEALHRLGLNSELPVLYVTGGAQGANALNKVVADALPDLLKDWQIIHQCGVNSMEYDATYLAEIANGLDRDLACRYLIKPYVGQEIVDVFAVVDILLSRSGAAIINEIIHIGLAAILVPYPASIAQEQQRLAQMLEEIGAAIVIDQTTLTKDKLIGVLGELGPVKRALMRARAKSLEIGRAH